MGRAFLGLEAKPLARGCHDTGVPVLLAASRSALAALPPRYSETTAIAKRANRPATAPEKGGDAQETGNPDKAKDLTQFPALWNIHSAEPAA